MDEKKGQVTVRINGKDKLKQGEEIQEPETAAAREEQDDFPWMLPEKKPTRPGSYNYKKKKKHKAKSSTGWANDGKRRSPQLPLNRKRKTKNNRFTPTKSKSKSKQPKSGHSKKHWITALSAIFVGILMGFIVLMLFTEDHKSAPTADGNETTNEPASANNVLQSNSNLDLSLKMIQGGAYSTDNKANEAATRIKDSGFAAVLTKVNDSELTHMIIGTALDSSGAQALKGLYKEKGQKVYSKSWKVTVEEAMIKNKETRGFIDGGKNILTASMSISVQGLTSEVPAMTDEQWSELQGQYDNWKSYAEEHLVALPKQTQKPALAFMDDIQAAIEQLKKYQKSPGDSGLWNVQQAILNAILSYKNTTESLAS